MYGLSDHSNGMPLTRLSATLHGSSRYATRIPTMIEHMFDLSSRRLYSAALIRVDDDLPPSTRAPDGRQLL